MKTPADSFFVDAAPREPLCLPAKHLLFERYLVGPVLGRPGGFGLTYLGWDSTLRVQVAIKEFLPRHLAGRATDGISISPNGSSKARAFVVAVRGFLAEARILARLRHPNVVRVLNFFEGNGTAYLVMEYHKGASLAQYLERAGGRLPWPHACETLLAVSKGLEATHRSGLLHCDIKPPNIYLSDEGEILLLDYGAARVQAETGSRAATPVALTHGYAAPEMYPASRGELGPWTDVYACGATLYQMLTANKPPTATERLRQDALIPPHTLEAGLPREVGELILRSLDLDPKIRIASAETFGKELTHALARAPEGRQDSPRHSLDLPSSSSSSVLGPDLTLTLDALSEGQTGKGSPAPPGAGQTGRGRIWGWLAAPLLLFLLIYGLGAFRDRDGKGQEQGQGAPLEATAATNTAVTNPPPSDSLPGESSESADQPLQAPPTARILVDAAPWARIVNIQSSTGSSLPLPEDRDTPFHCELEPGRYTIFLERESPGIGQADARTERRRIEVEAEAGRTRSVQVDFSDLDALAYFKRTGW